MSGRERWSAWLPVAGWVLLIFALSSVPNLTPPTIGVPMTDKLCHLGEYGVLGLLVARAAWPEARAWRAGLSGALLGLALGTLDENYQRLTPGREVSALDGVADMLGAGLGALAWSVWTRWWRRRRQL